MIKLEKAKVVGWEPAIRGMRNPMNSWDKLDSYMRYDCDACKQYDGPYTYTPTPLIGPNDHDLMMRLSNGGSVHAKYRRMIVVYVDITAPLYWWKEFDTYKVGTVANSCSTMHKIQAKEFTEDDFSCEHLMDIADCIADHETGFVAVNVDGNTCRYTPKYFVNMLCEMLNYYRQRFLETSDKRYWWQMIQLLPSSYNQKRTVMLSYEVLAGIYPSHKDHKLDEWHDFCDWIKDLPYSEVIIGEKTEDGE